MQNEYKVIQAKGFDDLIDKVLAGNKKYMQSFSAILYTLNERINETRQAPKASASPRP